MSGSGGRGPFCERRSGAARAAPGSILLGSALRRRPVTASAAPERSIPRSPSVKENRRKARGPALKYWAAATETAAPAQARRLRRPGPGVRARPPAFGGLTWRTPGRTR
jgi:hypothetical protein